MGWIADLLEQIPSAAAYKIQLEKLDSDYKILKAEHEHLKSENAHLRSKLDAAERKIKRLNDETQEKGKLAHSSDRSEIETRILRVVARYDGQLDADEIGVAVGINPQAAQFHLEEMGKLVREEFTDGYWSLTQEGRRYLMQRGLLN
jgi:chromosome segregation ATPase